MSVRVDHEVVIVGTGFSGVGMAVALRAAGVDDFVMLEKADEIGGTWRENRYPGCESDIPSHLYSFSFELNPYWSRTYAPADEIQDYLLFCVEKYDLRRHVSFDSTVQQATYDEASATWEITVASSWGTLRTVRTRALILGVGALHEPVVPEIPGLETFAGELMHTATWQPGTTVTAKRVAVIGTGSSGVQIVPPLVEDADAVTVFQRSAPWVLPRVNTEYSDKLIDTFEQHPAALQAHRTRIRATHELKAIEFTRRPGVRKAASRIAQEHLRAAVKTPELRARLTPDYTIGCRRPILSNDYYPALAQGHVTLETDPIYHVEPHAVVTSGGVAHRADVLVLATGFDPSGSYRYLGITGANGRVLADDWASGIESYLGVTVPNYPNMFVLLGPNTLVAHTSTLLMVEAQIGLVMKLLRERENRRASSVAVRPQVVPGFTAELARRTDKSVLRTPGCRGWYLDSDGTNRTLWPGSVAEYERRTAKPEMIDYEFN